MSLQEIFNVLSLTKDASIWESDEDSDKFNRKRLTFLATYDECGFTKLLDKHKGPGRKNETICHALLKKSETAEIEGSIRLLGQALAFCSPGPTMDQLLRLRSIRLEEVGLLYQSLSDLQEIAVRSEGDTENLRRLISRIKERGETNYVSDKKVLDLRERHKYLQHFSAAVSINSSRNTGRYLSANRDIKPGELIAHETAYIALLDKRYSRDHCDYCMQPLAFSVYSVPSVEHGAPSVQYSVPCITCSSVSFCSPECRTQATYHTAECLVLDQINLADTEVWQLALRIVASWPVDFWLERSPEYKSQNEQYSSKDLSTVYNLVTHKGTGDRPAPVLMKEALTAVFFLRVLKYSGYFGQAGNAERPNLGSSEVEVGILLLHFMRVVFFNSHEATELMKDSQTVQKIGVCLNPSLALINHSCDPNYSRVMQGRRSLGFATRLIREGEEIQDAYSPTFFMALRGHRLEVTQRYNFDCVCTACVENWPTESEMKSGTEKSEDWNGTEVELTSLEKRITQMLSPMFLKTTPSVEAMGHITSCLQEARDKIKHPNKNVLKLEILLHKLLWQIHG